METGSNASLCSDDDVNDDGFDGSFAILDEEEGEEGNDVDDEDREYDDEGDESPEHHSPAPINGVLEAECNRNASNVDDEVARVSYEMWIFSSPWMRLLSNLHQWQGVFPSFDLHIAEFLHVRNERHSSC